jgi:hypothetical protein
MKTIAIILLAITMFVSGMCVRGAIDDIKTRDWINPAKIDTVTNPFLPDQLRAEQQMDTQEWQK